MAKIQGGNYACKPQSTNSNSISTRIPEALSYLRQTGERAVQRHLQKRTTARFRGVGWVRSLLPHVLHQFSNQCPVIVGSCSQPTIQQDVSDERLLFTAMNDLLAMAKRAPVRDSSHSKSFLRSSELNWQKLLSHLHWSLGAPVTNPNLPPSFCKTYSPNDYVVLLITSQHWIPGVAKLARILPRVFWGSRDRSSLRTGSQSVLSALRPPSLLIVCVYAAPVTKWKPIVKALFWCKVVWHNSRGKAPAGLRIQRCDIYRGDDKDEDNGIGWARE